MDIFGACQKVNDLLMLDNGSEARNELIKVLDILERKGIEYDSLINHLIRETGLYPYMQIETASWQDRFAYEAFKVDIGDKEPVTLHREQSSLLRRLIDGESLAISAPTSFGKSFIIDSFISIKQPRNVVIIVPTIALTDETRRRLHRKFSDKYKIITTTDVELANYNIFIFPQERAINYADKITELDILVIDEFYKASPSFDKERSPSLLRAMLKLGKKAKQKYFLAPNISRLKENPFTKGMQFDRLDFNTVFLEVHDLYKEINRDEIKKSSVLINILDSTHGKSLIYAGTYPDIDKVANLLIDNYDLVETEILKDFEEWLAINYAKNWHLTNLVKRGTGIHNGQLHRSLSQIQIKLFEENKGLTNLISTSSIIEGVNTSAENVIIWRNKNGPANLNDFTYKNIMGRGGRMFRHFIGKIYVLESPPESTETQLELSLPDELLGDIDEKQYKQELTQEQIEKIISYKEEMANLLGEQVFKKLQKENAFQISDSRLIMKVAKEITGNPEKWYGLTYLNSSNIDDWDHFLYKIIKLKPGGWDIEYSKFVGFIKVLSQNWRATIPELLYQLDEYDIGVDHFFKLERNATFKLAALLNDVNVIQKAILNDKNIDISHFVAKVSHAFLPSSVYQLEEYGLPRMITKKIHNSGLIDFTDAELTLHRAIDRLSQIGTAALQNKVPNLDSFDRYILEYFFDGISLNKQ